MTSKMTSGDKGNPTLSMGANELHNRLEGMTSKVNYVGTFGRVMRLRLGPCENNAVWTAWWDAGGTLP